MDQFFSIAYYPITFLIITDLFSLLSAFPIKKKVLWEIILNILSSHVSLISRKLLETH